MPDAHIAPRNEVLRVQKAGMRGATQWVHTLSCGHNELRLRRSPSPTMGCTQCLSDMRMAAEWVVVDLTDSIATYQLDESLSGSAWISRQLNVPEEMIQAVYSQRAGSEILAGFSVWVPMDAIPKSG